MTTEQMPMADEYIEIHPRDILVKTEKGNLESRTQTAESSLPRKLRTLLLAVDGKSPFHLYVESLGDRDDVSSLYATLESGGYITRIRRGGIAASA